MFAFCLRMGTICASIAKVPVSKAILPSHSLERFRQQPREQSSQLGIAGFANVEFLKTSRRARPITRDPLSFLQVPFGLEPIVQISSVNATAFQV